MRIYAASYLLPISSPPIAGGALAVKDGRIVAVGKVHELRAQFSAPVTDLHESVIMPGLVNAHTHLELTHFPAWKLRKELDYLPKRYVEWIQQVVKIKRALEPGDLEHSVREGMRLCLESGTTAVGDILSDLSLVPLYRDTPLTGRLFLEAIGHDPLLCDTLVARIEATLETLQGGLLPGLSPHTPHTVSGKLFRCLQALSEKISAPKAVHLSETADEALFMHDSSGAIAELLYPMAHWEQYLPHPMRTTSTRYLDELGVLDSATLAVHAVHVTPNDVSILKERGVSVVLCPRSNDRLFVGCAPHKLLKESGLQLALGTDSLASNDSLSLWDEINFLQQVAPGVFSCQELLTMATLGGARALRIDADTGSLQAGKRADFQVLGGCNHDAGAGIESTVLARGRLEQVYLAGTARP
ncbi:amidohydrolase family protein [Geomonas nitrogeniifigens]|uniref:Amidohydrolase family protein n=1 Tax=Geomonas diazotrophica TaxID=2843197 RepID=A0ABX8JPT6_9BACT|nr:amidohydrolase family protein [Geomonas nitrogeniifigens]QWV98634.1 amidohydrolase family protein [Geomonas nitrogeniifigens]QXE87811.1 amidohydrolase family protein [Geomonas nitrogeniifigens]